jgi:hypothetical protein
MERRASVTATHTDGLGTSEGLEMNVAFKIPRKLLDDIQIDLSRPHQFAGERVGFVACTAAALSAGGVAVIAHQYLPVADDHYEQDWNVGAMMGPSAIRLALQYSYRHRVSMFHVHRHDHNGTPAFSHVDISESKKFVPDFWKVQRHRPHGALVLSFDAIYGLCWLPNFQHPLPFSEYVVVGFPTTRALRTNGTGLQQTKFFGLQ